MPLSRIGDPRKKASLGAAGVDPTESSGTLSGAKSSSCQVRSEEFYFYKTPPAITPDSEVQVTCEYDTSADTAPVLPGWGTRNEMCLTVLMVALPPG